MIFGSEDRRLKMEGFSDLRLRRSKMGGLRSSDSKNEEKREFFEEPLPSSKNPPFFLRSSGPKIEESPPHLRSSEPKIGSKIAVGPVVVFIDRTSVRHVQKSFLRSYGGKSVDCQLRQQIRRQPVWSDRAPPSRHAILFRPARDMSEFWVRQVLLLSLDWLTSLLL